MMSQAVEILMLFALTLKGGFIEYNMRLCNMYVYQSRVFIQSIHHKMYNFCIMLFSISFDMAWPKIGGLPDDMTFKIFTIFNDMDHNSMCTIFMYKCNVTDAQQSLLLS